MIMHFTPHASELIQQMQTQMVCGATTEKKKWISVTPAHNEPSDSLFTVKWWLHTAIYGISLIFFPEACPWGHNSKITQIWLWLDFCNFNITTEGLPQELFLTLPTCMEWAESSALTCLCCCWKLTILTFHFSAFFLHKVRVCLRIALHQDVNGSVVLYRSISKQRLQWTVTVTSNTQLHTGLRLFLWLDPIQPRCLSNSVCQNNPNPAGEESTPASGCRLYTC